MLFPFFKTKSWTHRARRNIKLHHSSFNNYSARTTHRIKQSFIFRSVKAGDLVHVRGCLMREQAEGQDLDPAPEESGDLVLVPGASGFNAPSVLEMTCAGSPGVRGPARMKVGLGVAMGLAVFALLFIGGGELAYQMVSSSGEAKADAAEASGGISHALAAATPLRRRSALSSLHQALVRGRGYDLQPVIGLNDLLGQCEDSFALLMRFHRYAEAIEQRESCPDSDKPHTIAEAYLRLGRFKEASDVLAAHPPPDDEPAHRMSLWTEVHLLAELGQVLALTLLESSYREGRLLFGDESPGDVVPLDNDARQLVKTP